MMTVLPAAHKLRARGLGVLREKQQQREETSAEKVSSTKWKFRMLGDS